MKIIEKLASCIGQYWKDTILTWIFVFFESLCEVLAVFFMRDLLDGVKAVDANKIYLYAGIIAGMAVFAAVMGILSGVFCASAAAGFGKNLRQKMYERIQKFSFKNIDKFSTSSIVTRTTTDVTNVQNAFLQAMRAVVRAPLIMIFSLVVCFIIEPKLAWIFLVIIPICLGILLLLAGKVHPYFVKVFDTYDKLNEEVEEDVDGIRVIKSFNREEHENQKFKGISGFIYKNFVHAEKVMSWNQPLVNLGVYAAILGIAYLGTWLIISTGETEFSIGDLNTLITFVMLIMMSLVMVSMVYVMITIGRNSAERIIEILEEEPDIVSPENALTDLPNGEVTFKDVNFAYNQDKYVLRDINLSFPSGALVGILGSTGSGKTSLVNLIARLYDTSTGEVLVAGHNVKEYDLTLLRDSVAVVLQKNTLFSGTILENLKWGNENATDKEINDVCEIAQVNQFITSLPDGLNTVLDEGGTNVSGGQKQRICIARALLKKPKILILDDSTSACDTHTDALIRQALKENKKDVSKFIISQRVLSLKDCDTILVMDQGKVIAQGNSEELIKNCAVYRELYESQLGGDFDAES